MPITDVQRTMLEHNMQMASQTLKALSGGGPMGLTPDTVKATAEWQQAKQAYDKAFQALRAFNTTYKPTRRAR